MKHNPLRLLLIITSATTSFSISPSRAAVTVDNSTLIAGLDYSDTYAIGPGAATAARQAYPAQTFPLPAGVEGMENTHGNPATAWPSNAWSIATDSAVNPGGFGYPGGSGAGTIGGGTYAGILNNGFVGTGGAGDDRLWSDNFQVGGVPEPSISLLFGLGASLFLMQRRRR